MSIIFKAARKEAIASGDLFYFTGKACKNNHKSKRYTRGGMCYDCLKMHRDDNKKKNLVRATLHAKNNPEMAKDRCLRWRAKNRTKVNLIEAKRRAALIKATPSWLTQNQIDYMDSLYEKASNISKITGVKHHVDHIIPLQGNSVCGMHVPWNLRIIPAAANLKKHNKLEERFAA